MRFNIGVSTNVVMLKVFSRSLSSEIPRHWKAIEGPPRSRASSANPAHSPPPALPPWIAMRAHHHVLDLLVTA